MARAAVPEDARASPLRRLAAPAHRAAASRLDVALPRLCPACRDLVTDNGLCARLLEQARPSSRRPIARGSAFRSPTIAGPGILSMQAIADPPAYQRARAAVRYDDVARTLVHAFKYGDRLDLAPMHRPLDGERRPRAPRRRRRAGAGAAALAPAVDAPLQPVGRARRGDLARAAAVAVAHAALKRVKATRAAGRAVAHRARRQRAGRLPRAARRQGRR